MRARAAWLSVFLLLGACGDDESFDPMAKVKIHTDGRVGDFDKMVDAFAAKRGMIIWRGNFPLGNGGRDDRWVDNIEIDVDKTHKTFLVIENFRRADTMDGAVYSHELPERWTRLWNDFLAAATAAFGPQNVEIINPTVPFSETKPKPGGR